MQAKQYIPTATIVVDEISKPHVASLHIERHEIRFEMHKIFQQLEISILKVYMTFW